MGASSPGRACSAVCTRSIEGGELFERIVDEDYHLTEVDTMVFVRQICDGILFMHKMRVLHLDLKVLRGGSQKGRSLNHSPPNVLLSPVVFHPHLRPSFQ